MRIHLCCTKVLPAIVLSVSALVLSTDARGQSKEAFRLEVDRRTEAVTPKVISWRRDIHQNPELGNREFRTAKLVAGHLRSLGIEVREGIAHTGVVGVLRGGHPRCSPCRHGCATSHRNG